MKTIVIMRHAKSSWADVSLSDYDRPLNKRGKHDAPRMGRLIYQNDLIPQLIITSSAKRAKKTAQAAADSLGYDGQIEVTRELYHAGAASYIERLNGIVPDYSRVMVIGHNPGIEELIEDLTGLWERMPTAALAVIDLPIENWSELTENTQGKLVNLWIPRELPN